MSKKNNNENQLTVEDIEKGLQTVFPSAIDNMRVEEEDEPNSFTFEIDFAEDVKDLPIPDGMLIGYLDFKELYAEGFIDGLTFMEYVREAEESEE